MFFESGSKCKIPADRRTISEQKKWLHYWQTVQYLSRSEAVSKFAASNSLAPYRCSSGTNGD
jgi:hypothetical protein